MCLHRVVPPLCLAGVAAGMISWQEFADTNRKIERFSGAVRGIKNLISWWSSLSEVEHQSSLNVDRLVLEGEHILAASVKSWCVLSYLLSCI